MQQCQLQVPQNMGNLLTGPGSVIFSRTLLHRISKLYEMSNLYVNCVMKLYLEVTQSNGLLERVHSQMLFDVLNIFVKYGHPNALFDMYMSYGWGSISQGPVNRQRISRCHGQVIRHNAITQCASGNAWADVSRSLIRFTYSSVARHIEPCICHNSQTYTWNDVIPYKGRIIRVFIPLPSQNNPHSNVRYSAHFTFKLVRVG
jgi:hypothetical protein